MILFRLVALILLLNLAPAALAAETLTLLQSSDGGPYREFADALNLALAQQPGRYRIERITLDENGAIASPLPTGTGLVVAVGAQAAEEAFKAGTPDRLLCVLLPRYRFDELRRAKPPGSGRQVSAIYLDQPYARQFDLLRLALPHLHSIGVVLGPASADKAPELKGIAQNRHIELRIEQIGDQSAIIPALGRMLPGVEALLALPDPLVFNRDTVRPILLTTYRFQRPLAGFSKAYVTAGALLGVYSTPAHIARQLGEILQGGIPPFLPAPIYPRYFDVSVNHSVANSLRIDLPDEGTLREQLTRSEEKEEAR